MIEVIIEIITNPIVEGIIIIPLGGYALHKAIQYFRNIRPAKKLLQGLAKKNEECVFWLRDAFLPPGFPIYEIYRGNMLPIPNVSKWWAEVDAKVVADVLNVLGNQGKSDHIEFHVLGANRGELNANIVCIGAQFPQANMFFNEFENVFYRMDNQNIIEINRNQNIPQQANYGYGIIIKARNPHKLPNGGVAFLIGGFGTLGTEAAGYYFRTRFKELGKRFGKKCFGVVVRASIAGGPQSVERLEQYDTCEDP